MPAKKYPSIKRFMQLNPSIKTIEHAKRLLKEVKRQDKEKIGFSLDDVLKGAVK